MYRILIYTKKKMRYERWLMQAVQRSYVKKYEKVGLQIVKKNRIKVGKQNEKVG